MSKFLIIYFFLFSSSLWAAEAPQAKVYGEDRTVELKMKVGETFSAVIEIWPLSPEVVITADKLVGKKLSKDFFVPRVHKIERSANNEEVLQIFLNLTAVGPGKVTQSELVIGELKVTAQLERISIINDLGMVKQITFLTQDLFGLPWNYLLIFLPLFILFVVAFVWFIVKKRKHMKAMWEEKEKKKVRDHWAQVFLSAKERNDFEYIYKNKSKWKDFLPKMTPPVMDFLSAVDRHQYKEVWSDSDLQEIIQYHDEVKGIFQ